MPLKVDDDLGVLGLDPALMRPADHDAIKIVRSFGDGLMFGWKRHRKSPQDDLVMLLTTAGEVSSSRVGQVHVGFRDEVLRSFADAGHDLLKTHPMLNHAARDFVAHAIGAPIPAVWILVKLSPGDVDDDKLVVGVTCIAEPPTAMA